MSGHLKRGWESYRERVIPVDAPPIQVQESQRAFYAGAAHLWHLLTFPGSAGGILTSGPDADEGSMSAMDGLDAELEEYVAAVKAGGA